MDDKPKPSVHFCQVGLLPTQWNPQSHQCGQYGGGHMICFFCPEEPAEVVHKHSPSRPVERGSTGFSGRRGSRGPASTAPDGGSEVEPPGVQTQGLGHLSGFGVETQSTSWKVILPCGHRHGVILVSIGAVCSLSVSVSPRFASRLIVSWRSVIFV